MNNNDLGRRKMNISLSLSGSDLLLRLARKNGISQSAVIEILIRDRARAEGLIPPLRGVMAGAVLHIKPEKTET